MPGLLGKSVQIFSGSAPPTCRQEQLLPLHNMLPWGLTSVGNPIVEIRWSSDHLISTMEFLILVRQHTYILKCHFEDYVYFTKGGKFLMQSFDGHFLILFCVIWIPFFQYFILHLFPVYAVSLTFWNIFPTKSTLQHQRNILFLLIYWFLWQTPL